MPREQERGLSIDPIDSGRFFEELPWAVVSFSFAILMVCVAAVAVRIAVYAFTGV